MQNTISATNHRFVSVEFHCQCSATEFLMFSVILPFLDGGVCFLPVLYVYCVLISICLPRTGNN